MIQKNKRYIQMKTNIKYIIGILFLFLIFEQEIYSLDTKCSVGTIGGTVDINALGAATYQIPIEVAPGEGGVQPSLSLVYNSQAGNGIAGYGFNIGGLSAITRVPYSIYSDGAPYGVENRYLDGLSLDGNRLIPFSSVAGYDGAEFHTETETFMKVIQHGSFGHNGANWFEAIGKDGVVYHYGCRTGKIKFYHNKKKSVEEWISRSFV